MTKEIKLKMIQMPNFICIEQSARPRQEGFNQITIPVKDFTEEEAVNYAEEMKQAFINHWKFKTNQP